MLADADAALARLSQATLLGRGLGAYVALLLAGSRPLGVRGALLCDGAGLAGGGAEPRDPTLALPGRVAPAEGSRSAGAARALARRAPARVRRQFSGAGRGALGPRTAGMDLRERTPALARRPHDPARCRNRPAAACARGLLGGGVRARGLRLQQTACGCSEPAARTSPAALS